jgi:hypothetical protein
MTEPCAKPPEASKCLGGKHHPSVLNPQPHCVKRCFCKSGKAISLCTNHLPVKGRQTTLEALLKGRFKPDTLDKVPFFFAMKSRWRRNIEGPKPRKKPL